MRWLFIFIILPLSLLVGLFFLATDSGPSLSRPAMIGMADLEKGKALIDSLGLRRMREGESRQLLVAESDLDRGVNYLAARLAKGSAGASIALEQLVVRASVPLPLVSRWLNLELALVPQDDMLVPADMHLGRLPIPAAVSGDLLAFVLALSPYSEELAAARELLDSAHLTGDGVALSFTWRGAAVDRAIAGGAGKGAEDSVIQAYRQHLGQAVKAREKDFAVLLGSAFELAKARSGGGDPVAENKAAITALAELAVGGKLLSRRGMANLQRSAGYRLAGRGDFSQHFALSAFLSATGGAGLSDMAGLYKELKDTRQGSGFSFTDLAADRAGSRFGEVATRSPARARQVQNRLAGVKSSEEFFPAIADLPEFMGEDEFQARFGGVGQPPYKAMVDSIEGRIAALPIFRE